MDLRRCAGERLGGEATPASQSSVPAADRVTSWSLYRSGVTHLPAPLEACDAMVVFGAGREPVGALSTAITLTSGPWACRR